MAEGSLKLPNLSDRSRVVQVQQQLSDAADNWSTLTNQQKDAAMKLTVRAVAQIIDLFVN